MTKRLHVLCDAQGVTCVIFSEVAVVNAAHKRELIHLAHTVGLHEPITLVSTSPIQAPLSLMKLGLREMCPMLYQ
jgi:hypothetical protein